MSNYPGRGTMLAATVAIGLLPAAAPAQEGQQRGGDALKQAKVMPTPMASDGHPDLSGIWNGGSQLANIGIEIGPDGARDTSSGTAIPVFPAAAGVGNDSDIERANALVRRMGSNKPLYMPEYWARVQNFDSNSNDDPAYHCMAAGVPRIGVPSQIVQTPKLLVLLYPGQGGLLATQTVFRTIPTDGRKHSDLDDLDPTWNGEGIGHWDGDTMVIDTIGFNSSSFLDQVGGYFHGENMHVVERLHRDGNKLTWQATVDDPDVLLKPWTTTKRVAILNPDPNALLPEPLPCSERDFDHVVTKEHH